MLEGGYIKLYRSLLSWEWYGDIHTRVLFVHLLLTVNHQRRRWQGVTVERGQRVASFGGLARETGLSLQNVKTAVAHLRSTGELTYRSTRKYSVFTVVNYDRFQGPAHSQPTGGPGAPPLPAAMEEGKKERREEEPCGDGRGDFERFWSAYPRKVGKGAARRCWERLHPGEELARRITAAVERDKEKSQWRREDGRYIPHPATWLYEERWEDGPEAETAGRRASYDISELEELARFDLPDELREAAPGESGGTFGGVYDG